MAFRPEILTFVTGPMCMLVNFVVLVVAVKLGSYKMSSQIFICSMSVCGFLFAMAATLRELSIMLNVTDLIPCYVILIIGIGAHGGYVLNFLFIYIELFISIKTMTIKSQIIPWRASLCLSILAILASLAFPGFGSLTFESDLQLTTYLNCMFGLFSLPLQVGFYAILLGTLLATIVIHGLTIRKIQNSCDNLMQGAIGQSPGRNVAILKQRKKTLSTTKRLLVSYTLSWGVMLLIQGTTALCQPCKESDKFMMAAFIMSQQFAMCPYIINGIIILAKNDKFVAMMKKFKDRICSKKIVPGVVGSRMAAAEGHISLTKIYSIVGERAILPGRIIGRTKEKNLPVEREEAMCEEPVCNIKNHSNAEVI